MGGARGSWNHHVVRFEPFVDLLHGIVHSGVDHSEVDDPYQTGASSGARGRVRLRGEVIPIDHGVGTGKARPTEDRRRHEGDAARVARRRRQVFQYRDNI